MPKPLTWRRITARYSRYERHIMRQLATSHPDEALVLHEIKARLDAIIVPDFKRP